MLDLFVSFKDPGEDLLVSHPEIANLGKNIDDYNLTETAIERIIIFALHLFQNYTFVLLLFCRVKERKIMQDNEG